MKLDRVCVRVFFSSSLVSFSFVVVGHLPSTHRYIVVVIVGWLGVSVSAAMLRYKLNPLLVVSRSNKVFSFLVTCLLRRSFLTPSLAHLLFFAKSYSHCGYLNGKFLLFAVVRGGWGWSKRILLRPFVSWPFSFFLTTLCRVLFYHCFFLSIFFRCCCLMVVLLLFFHTHKKAKNKRQLPG